VSNEGVAESLSFEAACFGLMVVVAFRLPLTAVLFLIP
jgi:hypothetical protein